MAPPLLSRALAMTILYRTPNVLIGPHEWHAAVEMYHGRIARYFRFRLNATPKRKWLSIAEWPGRKPTWREFDRAFGPFKRHMLQAERSVVENGRAEPPAPLQQRKEAA